MKPVISEGKMSFPLSLKHYFSLSLLSRPKRECSYRWLFYCTRYFPFIMFSGIHSLFLPKPLSSLKAVRFVFPEPLQMPKLSLAEFSHPTVAWNWNVFPKTTFFCDAGGVGVLAPSHVCWIMTSPEAYRNSNALAPPCANGAPGTTGRTCAGRSTFIVCRGPIWLGLQCWGKRLTFFFFNVLLCFLFFNGGDGTFQYWIVFSLRLSFGKLI